jgi:2-oxoglutarate ferredoxin oxidoreductase subunit beta
MVNIKDLDRPGEVITWCPGCGNFAILTAIKKALVYLKIEPHNTVLVSGIGCSSHLPNWINTYGFCGIHGRALPPATGIKLVNNKLTVIAQGGDGDGYSIGTNHFIHACRRNIDIVYITHNNQIYGLTTGQTSPTSDKGTKTKSTPFGVLEEPVNPIALALSSGATFVARGYSGKPDHLTKMVMQAIRHKGFALVDVLQPCVTFNKVNTYQWFNERVYELEGRHDPSDKVSAFKRSLEWGNHIPIGVFYKASKPTYEDGIPQISKKPLVKHKIKNVNVKKLIEEFV